MPTKYQAKRNEITCYCDAEKYPHRLESTAACRELYNNEDTDSESHAEWSAGMLAQFDKTEAQAINANRELLK